MKLQTVIEHDLEVISTNVSESQTNIAVDCVFKVKHSNGVKNNTITLKNLVRTSPIFRQLIADTVNSYISPSQKADIAEGYNFNSIGGFDIYPSSGGKGRWYLHINKTAEALSDIENTVKEILRRY